MGWDWTVAVCWLNYYRLHGRDISNICIQKRTAGADHSYNNAGPGVDAGPVAGWLLAKSVLWHEIAGLVGERQSATTTKLNLLSELTSSWRNYRKVGVAAADLVAPAPLLQLPVGTD
jgi:hypothetical protein